MRISTNWKLLCGRELRKDFDCGIIRTGDLLQSHTRSYLRHARCVPVPLHWWNERFDHYASPPFAGWGVCILDQNSIGVEIAFPDEMSICVIPSFGAPGGLSDMFPPLCDWVPNIGAEQLVMNRWVDSSEPWRPGISSGLQPCSSLLPPLPALGVTGGYGDGVGLVSPVRRSEWYCVTNFHSA